MGLNGLGYGRVLRSTELSLEWLRTNASLAALPISAAEKERIVNAERGAPHRWCKLNDGWHIGRWKYSCERDEDEEESVEQAVIRDSNGEKEEQESVGKEGVAASEPLLAVEEDTRPDEGEVDGGESEVEMREEGEDEPPLSPLQLQLRSDQWQKATRGGWRLHSSSRLSCRGCRAEMTGYGYYVNSSGVQFVGRFIRGVLNDRAGVIIDRLGVYHGEVVKAADTGRGTFYYRDNHDVVTGMWEGGIVKYGSAALGDGMSLYTGAFHLNKPQGLGVTDFTPTTPPPQLWETYTGGMKACYWKGWGVLRCSDRLVHARWKGEGVDEEAVGSVEGEDEELKQHFRYGGQMKGNLPEGDGWMVWDDLTNEHRASTRQAKKRVKEQAARRKAEHQQRVAGEWSSLPGVLEQQAALSASAQEVESALATLDAHLPVPSNPRELVGLEASLYVGEFSRGKMHGQGRREWRNGDVYDGAWVQGICNGYGRWKSKDRGDVLGDVLYAGGWRNDKEHGVGTLIHSMPTLGRMLFHGRFNEGLMTGMGSVYFFDSRRLYYIGRMVRGAFDGEGLMQLEDGSLYLGMFDSGEFKGNGRWVDARDCSVYTGRFKNDSKHGAGQLVIHHCATPQPSTALDSAVAPLDAEQHTAESSSESSTELLLVAEQALSKCSHRVCLPRSFGAASHQYQAVYSQDEPLFRVLGRELDDLLNDIGYVHDAEDEDVHGLIKEEQLDSTRQKQRARKKHPPSQPSTAAASSRKVEAVAAVSSGVAEGAEEPLSLDKEEKEEKEEKEKEVQPLEDEDDGMRLLQHYQAELDRLSVRSKRKGRKETLSNASSISFPGSFHLEHSLRQPRPALSDFQPAACRSSPLRRIHLEKAVRLCVAMGLCSFAVTGHLPGDANVWLCHTCSGVSKGGAIARVEVCAACKAAGCHLGHELRPISVDLLNRTADDCQERQVAAAFYCSCGVGEEGSCHTLLDDWREEIRAAARPFEPDLPVELAHSHSHMSVEAAVPESNLDGPGPSEEAKAAASPAAELRHSSAVESAFQSSPEALLAHAAHPARSPSLAPAASPPLQSTEQPEAYSGSANQAMRAPVPFHSLPHAALAEWIPPSSLQSPPTSDAGVATDAAAAAAAFHRRGLLALPALKPRFPIPSSSIFKAPRSVQNKRWVRVDGKWKEVEELQQADDPDTTARISTHTRSADEANSDGQERKELSEDVEERKEGNTQWLDPTAAR